MISDREHIRKCLAGDSNDFRFLVERYQGAVYAFATTRIADRDRAREVTEETFVRAYFALAKLRNPEALHPWLLGIAGRVALEIRRNSRNGHADLGEIGDAVVEPTAQEPDLDQAIAGLPDGQRRIVLLRYFQRRTCREIAEELGVPLGTVTKNLSRAYEGLRAALGAQDETAEKIGRNQ